MWQWAGARLAMFVMQWWWAIRCPKELMQCVVATESLGFNRTKQSRMQKDHIFSMQSHNTITSHPIHQKMWRVEYNVKNPQRRVNNNVSIQKYNIIWYPAPTIYPKDPVGVSGVRPIPMQVIIRYIKGDARPLIDGQKLSKTHEPSDPHGLRGPKLHHALEGFAHNKATPPQRVHHDYCHSFCHCHWCSILQSGVINKAWPCGTSLQRQISLAAIASLLFMNRMNTLWLRIPP